jgi:hypothetical protein
MLHVLRFALNPRLNLPVFIVGAAWTLACAGVHAQENKPGAAAITQNRPADAPVSEKAPGEKPTDAAAAEEAARRFLEGRADSDWGKVREVWAGRLDDRLKNVLGELEFISLGTARRSTLFPSPSTLFVPYEVKLKHDGLVKKRELTLKLNKATGKWLVGGGI